jgi:hypothetical protein
MGKTPWKNNPILIQNPSFYQLNPQFHPGIKREKDTLNPFPAAFQRTSETSANTGI